MLVVLYGCCTAAERYRALVGVVGASRADTCRMGPVRSRQVPVGGCGHPWWRETTWRRRPRRRRRSILGWSATESLVVRPSISEKKPLRTTSVEDGPLRAVPAARIPAESTVVVRHAALQGRKLYSDMFG